MTCPKTKIETENHPPWGSWTLQWKGFHEPVWRRGRVLKIARPLRVQWSLGHLKRKMIFQNLHFLGGFQAFVFRGEWQNCKWYPLSSLANVPNRVMFLDVLLCRYYRKYQTWGCLYLLSSLKLTVRTWKWMVFQYLIVSFWDGNFSATFTVSFRESFSWSKISPLRG